MVRKDYKLCTTYSVEGNTARVVKTQVIDLTERRKKEQQKASGFRCARVRSIGPGYAAVFFAACLITLFICLNYIRVYSSITAHQRRIDALQTEIQTLHNENVAAQTDLELKTDLSYVALAAKRDLHMVVPNEDQLMYYDRSEQEYVRQREDLPPR